MNLDPYLVLLLTASAYILVFGGLSFLRRESLSVQFALEAIAVTAVLVGGAWLLGLSLSPFLLLIVLYLVTMRARLTVDVANFFARRGKYDLALRLYGLGLALWPDSAARLIVLTNRGVAELLSGNGDAAVQTLEGVLVEKHRTHLGVKYETAARYNLGYAYEKRGEGARAVQQYNEVIDLMPGSLYARAAEGALKRRREGTP